MHGEQAEKGIHFVTTDNEGVIMSPRNKIRHFDVANCLDVNSRHRKSRVILPKTWTLGLNPCQMYSAFSFYAYYMKNINKISL